MAQFVFQICGTILGLFLGIFIGIPMERAHFRDLEMREAKIRNYFMTDLKRLPNGMTALGSRMVTGQVVMGSDYLKTMLSRLRNIFGGEMKSFQKIMDRARREALLRAVDEAQRLGAFGLINIRYETSRIGSAEHRKGGVPMAEILCYGTAIFHDNAQNNQNDQDDMWDVNDASDLIS